MFLTGTAAEIISVVNMDRRTIGSGKPGPITRKLTDAFHRLVRENGTPIK
jgi:branched-chain amino acid aminotransferase